MTKQIVEEIDLTKDAIEDEETSSFLEAPYDPRPKEDSARFTIAIILIVLFAGILSVGLICVIAFPSVATKIQDYIQLIISPLVALVSAATGFYFGSKK